MLRLLSSRAQRHKDLKIKSKTCNVSINWIAVTEYSHTGAHMPGFQSFSGFLHHFVLTRLAISSIRVQYSISPLTKEAVSLP